MKPEKVPEWNIETLVEKAANVKIDLLNVFVTLLPQQSVKDKLLDLKSLTKNLEKDDDIDDDVKNEIREYTELEVDHLEHGSHFDAAMQDVEIMHMLKALAAPRGSSILLKDIVIPPNKSEKARLQLATGIAGEVVKELRKQSVRMTNMQLLDFI